MANRDGKGDIARPPQSPDPAYAPPPPPARPPFPAPRVHPPYPRILPFAEKTMVLTFAQTLRAARLYLALTQEQVSALAGMPREHISFIERGLYNVRLTTICVLAHALRMNPAELMPVLFRPDSTPVAHKALPLNKPPPAAPTPTKPQRPTPPAHL